MRPAALALIVFTATACGGDRTIALSWSLADGRSCVDAGVRTVSIIGGSATQIFPCADGFAPASVTTNVGRGGVQLTALSAEGAEQWHEVAEEVGRVILEHPHFVERKLNPNVEFYSAPLLYGLGLPLDLFTVAFAMSRIAGWMSHIREQLADNRLIRPKADYSGPAPRAFVPLDQRQ